MIEKICSYLTKKIRKKMPEIDNEKAEIINYGLQVIIGEIPKTFILLTIAYLFGVLKLTIIVALLITPYRYSSGGLHLKTHIGCMVATTVFYMGNAILSKSIIIQQDFKYILVAVIWIFSIAMIKLYAPADTENIPILRKKERRIKKVLSYITMTGTLIACVIVKNSTISNIMLIGVTVQTIMITRFAYKITNNKYGYEEYCKNNMSSVI